MSDESAAASNAPEDGDRCPECDQLAAWQVSRRHRFSPFGSVLLAVVAFWTAVFAWLWGLGYTLPLLFLAVAVIIGVSTRRAETCSNCGYVRPVS